MDTQNEFLIQADEQSRNLARLRNDNLLQTYCQAWLHRGREREGIVRSNNCNDVHGFAYRIASLQLLTQSSQHCGYHQTCVWLVAYCVAEQGCRHVSGKSFLGSAPERTSAEAGDCQHLQRDPNSQRHNVETDTRFGLGVPTAWKVLCIFLTMQQFAITTLQPLIETEFHMLPMRQRIRDRSYQVMHARSAMYQ